MAAENARSLPYTIEDKMINKLCYPGTTSLEKVHVNLQEKCGFSDFMPL
jgi:hypothetical protein